MAIEDIEQRLDRLEACINLLFKYIELKDSEQQRMRQARIELQIKQNKTE
jgi:hypothetical protein